MSTTTESVQLADSLLQVAYKQDGDYKETADFYSRWAKDRDYDAELNQGMYTGPRVAAAAVADCFPLVAARGSVRILDVAAGTGFVAQNLLLHGFSAMDALDPAEGMLEVARSKGLYRHYIKAYLDDKELPTLQDTYDCAVTSGGMGEGHIPYDAVDQLIRVVKPGGVIVLTMREEYLEAKQYRGRLEPHFAMLEERGLWRREKREIVQGYCFHHTGIVWIYRVLDSKC